MQVDTPPNGGSLRNSFFFHLLHDLGHLEIVVADAEVERGPVDHATPRECCM